jgi:outer membrane protein OmpA-like peptidoglycan-associated protein
LNIKYDEIAKETGIMSTNRRGGIVYILTNYGGLEDDTTRAPMRGKSGRWSSPPYLRFDNLDRFDFNRSSLTARLRSKVDSLATAVTLSWKSLQPITTVRLVGHTDSTGVEKYNRGLGDRRAQAVRDELLSKLKGLMGKVLIVVEPSPGESKPIADNRISDGRARNRRVEVFITTGAIPSPPPPTKDLMVESEKAIRQREADRPAKQPIDFRPIPPARRPKSPREQLKERLARLGWLGRRIGDAVISGSCFALEVLFTEAGGRLTDQQKEELRKQCKEAANKPIR